MSDVKALFKKKKGKKKKSKSFKKKLEEAGGQLPSGSKRDSQPEETYVSAGDSMLAAFNNTSIGKDMAVKTDLQEVEETPEVNLEDMNLREYRAQQAKKKTREEFHKTRKKLLKKASKTLETAAVAPAEPAVPVKMSWRERSRLKELAANPDIGKQLQSEEAFPTLGAAANKNSSARTSVWGQTADDVESDEEIDPVEEERKRLAAEAAAKLEEEKRAIWAPAEGVNDSMEYDVWSKKVNSALDEFIQIEDYSEAVLCFQELRNPAKHEEIAMKMIEKGMDNQPEKAQLLLADLMVKMRKNKPYMLTKEQLEGAFKEMEGFLDDLVVDFPKAKEVYATMKKRCQMKGVLEGGPKKRFIAAMKMDGAKEGYEFKMGAHGLGYYLAASAAPASVAAPAAPSSKPSPFGSARPVDIKDGKKVVNGAAPAPAKKKADPFGGAAPVKTRSDPFGGAVPVKKKVDPFGGAVPVKKKVDPFGGAVPVKKKVDPFGGAVPVKKKVDPFGGAVPVKKKVDPFGGAKPVDTSKAAEEDGEDPDPYASLRKKKKKKKKAGYVPDV